MATLIGRSLLFRRPISLGMTNILNGSGANKLEDQKPNTCTYTFVAQGKSGLNKNLQFLWKSMTHKNFF